MVLVDAAKGCATEPPDLSKYPVDFVVISFYKIFGYPTGLGALIARNDYNLESMGAAPQAPHPRPIRTDAATRRGHR
nr:molybdenum cofactor sulfurase [Quercus suber]